jgi:hypothetical protein
MLISENVKNWIKVFDVLVMKKLFIFDGKKIVGDDK